MPAPGTCLAGAGGGLSGRGFGGRKAAHGEKKRAQSGRKAAHAGASGASGVCAAPGSWAKPDQAGPFSGAGRAKAGRRRGKTGRSGALLGGYGGRWGRKSPFLLQKGRATGLWRGENWRRKLAGCVGLSGAFRESSGGFGGKIGASGRPFRAHIGRTCPLPLFFVDDAPSLGAIIWWFGRVAFFASQSDECVTPRAGEAARQGRGGFRGRRCLC